jgi:hypothetical protein
VLLKNLGEDHELVIYAFSLPPFLHALRSEVEPVLAFNPVKKWGFVQKLLNKFRTGL